MREPEPEQANDQELELAGFLADVVAEGDELASQAHPLPDFGEVLRRARALDPAAVSDEMLDEAAKLAPVVPIGGLRTAPEEAADEALRGFLDDARRHNEALVEERRLAGIPPLVRPAGAGRRRVGLMAFVGVAAALALALLGPALMTSSARVATPTSSAAMMQGIVDRVEHRVATLPAVEDRAVLEGGRAERPAEREVLVPGAAEVAPGGSSAELEPAESAAESAAEADLLGAEQSQPRARRTPDAEVLAAELRALDEEAQAAWRRGDLKGAERSFRRIIRRAPRGRWAQLAYGDLFSLVRQGGDPEAEVALWREYLRRYPKGPHADDAHAGTCRRSATATRDACWRSYLEARPRGAYRQQAAAALSREELGG